ncbi:MAG: methyltransferase domain-containing protein, partial [Bacteroidota bacterium]|nr:methyltransferase domain-containing protein [Bacteroidota bacterium]
MNAQANDRGRWIKKNRYYYKKLIEFLKFNIPEHSKVIEIGSGTGFLLNSLNPSKGVGIDISSEMIRVSKSQYPQYDFYLMDAEDLSIDIKFDFVLISDTIGYFEDVQKSFEKIRTLCNDDTKVIITYFNFLWLPLLNLAESLELKMPQVRNNWLDISDINNLLGLSHYDIIKSGRKILMPVYVPLLSGFVNNFIANLPLINKLCLTKFIISKTSGVEDVLDTVSVIVPARNEKGNIEQIVKRIPPMGKHTEIIFIEGNSTDDTFDEIKHICEIYSDERDLKFAKQEGKGKADAVRKGFEMATCKV